MPPAVLAVTLPIPCCGRVAALKIAQLAFQIAYFDDWLPNTAHAKVTARLPGLRARGRAPLQVHAEDFLRPAGERFEWGREDVESFRTTWLDAGALDREVLSRAPDGSYLPALWDAAADRSFRRAVEPVPPGAPYGDGPAP